MRYLNATTTTLTKKGALTLIVGCLDKKTNL